MYYTIEYYRNTLDANKVAILIIYKNNKREVIRIKDLSLTKDTLTLYKSNGEEQEIQLNEVKRLNLKFYFTDLTKLLPNVMKYGDTLEKAKVSYVFVKNLPRKGGYDTWEVIGSSAY